MLNNYHYFITLAEEGNISKAAAKLYISHQCLSKYLKNLEQEYRVTFFERSPQLKLTPAGEIYLETLRKIKFLENNLDSQLDDIRHSRKGFIRLGISEGRYRIMIPDLLARFKQLYPDVLLDVQSATSSVLNEKLLSNDLDLVLANRSDVNHNQLENTRLMEEKLYLVISDNMLHHYFPDTFPECCNTFITEGFDLTQTPDIPFVLNKRKFNSRIAIENYALAHDLHINCIKELTQLDLHFMLSARDYAASICWSMYLPLIQSMNEHDPHQHLNVFPIKDIDVTNDFVLVQSKGKILPAYGRDLVHLIKEECSKYDQLQPKDFQ